MRSLFRTLITLGISLWLVVPAEAQQLLHDNGTPDGRNGYPVSLGYETANDFSLMSFQSLSSFDW